IITAFGVACYKAYLVAKNFMHVNLEKPFVSYLLLTVVVFMLLFFAGASPDVMKREGTRWEKPAWVAAHQEALAHPPEAHAEHEPAATCAPQGRDPASPGSRPRSDMPPRSAGRLRLAAESERTPLIPSAVMGMLIFVLTELMLFSGLISAFVIVRAGAMIWPPPGQPRLPLQATAFNTLVLLASGVALFLAQRRFFRDREAARRPLLLAMLLGACFVV